MSRDKVAQWRREVPAYDRAFKAVQKCPVRLVAYLDENTRAISFVLHGDTPEKAKADEFLTSRGYAPGWVLDDRFEVPVWRKVVAR